MTAPDVLLLTIDALRVEHAVDLVEAAAFDWDLVAPCWSVAPITPVAVASLLSGRLPQHHGVRNVERYRLASNVPWLPEILAGMGWRTVGAGGMLPIFRGPLSRGFEEWIRPPEDCDLKNPPGWLGRIVERELARNDSRPTFLFAHLGEVHQPILEEGARFRDAAAAYRRTARRACVEAAQAVSRWTAERKRPALVIVSADHGESVLPSLPDWWFRHGRTVEDSALLVPLVAKWFGPDPNPVSAWREHEVSLLDVAPSILEAIGQPNRMPSEHALGRPVRPGSRVHYAESFLRPYQDGEPSSVVRRGTSSFRETLGSVFLERTPDWARSWFSPPADYHGPLRKAFAWVARAVREVPSIGFLAEPDPWSVATLLMLQDLGHDSVRAGAFFEAGSGDWVSLDRGGVDRWPEGIFDHVAWCAGIRGAVHFVGRRETRKVLGETTLLPARVLLGRLPPEGGTRREADLGREFCAFLGGVSEEEIRSFLLARGVSLPCAPEPEEERILEERMRALGYR